jgi:DNA-binding CsgD family transcriptional regulator
MLPTDRMTADDAVGTFHLLDRCRGLGADHQRWRAALADGLRPLVAARVVIAAEIDDFGPTGENRALAVTRLGWAAPRAEQRWLDYAAKAVHGKPEFQRLTAATGPVETLSRDEIWGRAAWYRSHAFREVHEPCGLDDYVFSIAPLPHAPGSRPRASSLWVHRAPDDPAFDDRDRAIIDLLHRELVSHLGRSLASASEPAPSAFSRRQREVLALLLDGLAEKDIASALKRSRATVHEHVLAVYRHYGVTSRAELLARFVGRAKPPADEA